MTSFRSQPYADASDLQAMIALLHAARSDDHLADYPDAGDLRELLQVPDVQAHTRLWRDAGGRLVAFAIVDPGLRNLLFELSTQAIGSEVEAQLMAWGVDRLRLAHPAVGDDLALDSCCADDNLARIALLQRHGFTPQAERTLRLFRPLDEPIPDPILPPGFRIDHVAGEHAVEKYVALHRAAFGTQNMTVDMRLGIMRAPGYDPQLDLIAVAPGGRWAALCVCQIHDAENVATGRNDGWTDPVGTHPGYRRRGLARALIVTGLRLLQQRELQNALLGTLNTNVAMLRLAESVGFRMRSTVIWFSKPLPAA